jgi:hypothetical protein
MGGVAIGRGGTSDCRSKDLPAGRLCWVELMEQWVYGQLWRRFEAVLGERPFPGTARYGSFHSPGHRTASKGTSPEGSPGSESPEITPEIVSAPMASI